MVPAGDPEQLLPVEPDKPLSEQPGFGLRGRLLSVERGKAANPVIRDVAHADREHTLSVPGKGYIIPNSFKVSPVIVKVRVAFPENGDRPFDLNLDVNQPPLLLVQAFLSVCSIR